MTSLVHNTDCMLGMKKHPDKHFDLAVCDVPYGIRVGKMAYLKENKTTVKQKNGTRLNPNTRKKIYEFSDWDNEPPSQEYFDELQRVSKHQIIFGIEYCTYWTGVGPGRIRWDKLVPDGVSFKRYEVAYCSLIDTEIIVQLLWAGMQQAKSLSEPTVPQGNKELNEQRIHPCHKPVMLYDILFKRFSTPGMKILDTHVGSGSSRIAADRARLDFVGYEINPIYFNDQEQRYRMFKRQLTLL